MKLRGNILSVLFIALLFSFSDDGAAGKDQYGVSEHCGDLSFSYSRSGASLKVFNIPFMKENSLWVITPDWLIKHYQISSQNDLIDKAKIEETANGKKITIFHELPPEYDCPFKGTQTFILTRDNKFTASLDFTFSKDVPAVIEWGVGRVNPSILIGRPFTAIYDDAAITGVIPSEAPGVDIAECAVARRFKSLSIKSRIGEVVIDSSADQDLILFDYRKNKWAQTDNPFFWFGFLDQPVSPKKRYRYSVTLSFPSKFVPESKEIGSVSGKPTLIPLDNARVPRMERDMIIPTPKKITWTNKDFHISSETKIFIGKPKKKNVLEQAMSLFLEDLEEKYRVEPQIIRKDFRDEKRLEGVIVEKADSSSPVLKGFPKDMKIPAHPEGYCLSVDEKNVFIAAPSEKGIFYAFATLSQMIRIKDGKVFIRGALIEDYPSLDFRGIHCLTGKNAGDQIAKAVKELMARFKINALVWQCEYLLWDSHPEIAHKDYGMDKNDARKVITAADKYFIEIIPLVQALGHVAWIFNNKQNLDLAEDPDTPYAISPTNPDSCKFIFDIYKETLDLFNPRYLHIGHDEVDMRGRFPYRSLEFGKTATDLIIENIQTLKSWLDKKNVKTMLWGDMFLWRDEGTDACLAPSLEDAQTRRSLLPRDVVITDWHYANAPAEDFKTLKIFRELGVEVIGASWYNPHNIYNLSRACVIYGAKGLLQTTWAGFNFKIDDNEKEWRQYWAYLLAAHYAWTGGDAAPEDLPFNAQKEFLDLWFGEKPLLKNAPGVAFDLSSICNRRLEDDDKGSGWLGLGGDMDFSCFPTGGQILNDTHFQIRKNARGESALLLAGKFNPKGGFPKKIDMALDPVSVSEIHVLLTASFRVNDGTPVGEFVFSYEDGKLETAPMIYGKNIFAFNDERTGLQSRVAWQGRARGGGTVSAWDFRWINPLPEKKLNAISISSKGTEAAPVILAITGVN